MKKSIFMVALAALAMTSCSQDEILEVNQDEIKFSAFTENASRATAVTSINDFKTYAYVGGTKYIDGLVATNNGGVYKFAEQGYYWPASAVNFYSVYPSTLSLTKDASTEAHSLEFTVDSDDNVDLLYSVLIGAVKGNATAGKIGLNFRHALSMVEFKVSSLGTYGLDVNVSQIELVNVKQTREFTLPLVSTTPWLDENPDADATTVDGASRGSWADNTNTTSATYTWGVSLAADATSGDATSAASGTFFLMPQTFTPATPVNGTWSNTYFLISCTIEKNGVMIHDTATNGKVAIPALGVGSTTEWKQGYKYQYTLTFGSGAGYQENKTDAVVVPMSFSVTVDQFQNATETTNVTAPVVG